jgi:type I restriction enzyme S subunit
MLRENEYFLKDICLIKGGKRLPKGHQLTKILTPHPYIKARDIGSRKIDCDNLEFISEDTFKRIKNYIVSKNDVCITIVGANIGDVGIVPEFLNGANLTENAVKLTKFKTSCSPTFISYVLSTPSYKSYMDVVAAGAAQPKLGLYKIQKIIINLPNFSTQQRIASILSAYDDLIEVNNQRIKLLEETARELYKEWFVRMRFPGYKKAKFVKGIPKDWSIQKVGNTFEILGGGTPSTEKPEYWDGDVNWYTPTDITGASGMFLQESSNKITEKGLKESSAKLFPSYSIMMTSRATIGAVGINITPGCTNQGFITCLPNKKVPFTFLYFWIVFNKEVFEMLGTGSTFLEITKGTFKRINIMTPTSELILKFHELVKPMFDQLEILQQQNTQLRQIRDRLLPRLVSGKLAVKI